MTSNAVGEITAIRGETITFGIRSTPNFTGTETVTANIKKAVNGSELPAESATVVVTPSTSFVAAAGSTRARHLFTITAAQSELLERGAYISTAKIVFADGTVDYTAPLKITIAGRT